jgi:hypothetical protein
VNVFYENERTDEQINSLLCDSVACVQVLAEVAKRKTANAHHSEKYVPHRSYIRRSCAWIEFQKDELKKERDAKKQ